MQGIKLVTFDATNTLLRFKIPPWEYYSIVGRNYGFLGTVEVLKSQMKESFIKMNAKHPNFGKNDVAWENWWKEVVKLTFEGQLPSYANVDRIASKLISEFRTTKCWDVAGGSYKLLEYLKHNGITVGVISNFDPRLIDILRNIRLYDNFDFVLTSYDVGYTKPDERIFRNALETCKKEVKPSQCLHIGDDLEKDYNGAKRAGWHAILVGSKFSEPPPGLDADHVFNSIEALHGALEQKKIIFL